MQSNIHPQSCPTSFLQAFGVDRSRKLPNALHIRFEEMGLGESIHDLIVYAQAMVRDGR